MCVALGTEVHPRTLTRKSNATLDCVCVKIKTHCERTDLFSVVRDVTHDYFSDDFQILRILF